MDRYVAELEARWEDEGQRDVLMHWDNDLRRRIDMEMIEEEKGRTAAEKEEGRRRREERKKRLAAAEAGARRMRRRTAALDEARGTDAVEMVSEVVVVED